MDVAVRDKVLRSALADFGSSVRRFGAVMAKKLRLRVTALQAADNLAVFWPAKTGPERCHELKGDQAGIFSMDLQHPYRLLFVPKELDSAPRDADERTRWTSIKSVELLRIENTHG